MVILKTLTTSQNINFTPRSETYNTLVVTNESTNVSTTITIASSTVNSYYHTISALFALSEGLFYTFQVKQNSTVVYNGKIYCTDATDLPNYALHNGEYISNTSINEYKTL